MRHLAVIFLCAALLMQTLCQVLLLGYFALNRTYVAQVLCENRARPEMHCEGRCFMRRRMAATI